jgi:hypothetical protein
MTWRSRTRWRVTRWTGTVLCLMVVALCILNLLVIIGFRIGSVAGGLQHGGVAVVDSQQASNCVLPRKLVVFVPQAAGSFRLQVVPASGPWVYQPVIPLAGGQPLAFVPLWLPLVIVVIPTAWLWWRDLRRYPEGHCQKCGYDLTGNVSGICPECGTPTEAGKPRRGA